MASEAVWRALVEHTVSLDPVRRATGLVVTVAELHVTFLGRLKLKDLPFRKCVELLDAGLRVPKKHLHRLAILRNGLVHDGRMPDSKETADLVVLAAREDLGKAYTPQIAARFAEMLLTAPHDTSFVLETMPTEVEVAQLQGTILLHGVVAILNGQLEQKMNTLEHMCPERHLCFSVSDAAAYAPIVAGDVIKTFTGLNTASKIAFCEQISRSWLTPSVAEQLRKQLNHRHAALHGNHLSVDLSNVIDWLRACVAAIYELDSHLKEWGRQTDLQYRVSRLEQDVLGAFHSTFNGLRDQSGPSPPDTAEFTTDKLWVGFVGSLLLGQLAWAWWVVVSQYIPPQACFFTLVESASSPLYAGPFLAAIFVGIAGHFSLSPVAAHSARRAEMKTTWAEKAHAAAESVRRRDFEQASALARIDEDKEQIVEAHKEAAEALKAQAAEHRHQTEDEKRLLRHRVYSRGALALALVIESVMLIHTSKLAEISAQYYQKCRDSSNARRPPESDATFAAFPNPPSSQPPSRQSWPDLGIPVARFPQTCTAQERMYYVLFQTLFLTQAPRKTLEESLEWLGGKPTKDNLVLIPQSDPQIVGLAATFATEDEAISFFRNGIASKPPRANIAKPKTQKPSQKVCLKRESMK